MKFKRNLLILSAVLIGILIVVVGCIPTTPTPVAVTGVTLDQTTMSLPAVGATGTLVATVAPATATNTSVTWSSSNVAVATVANGVVTPLAAGTTTITVTTVDGSFTATCAVTVAPVVVINIAAIPGVTAPVTGATPVTTITATTQYTGTVTWSPTATTFAASTAYTATITLTPTTGYTLTGVAANLFTVTGATDTNPVNSGIVTAIFPATAATIATAVIAGVTAPVTGATPVATITATTAYTATIAWSGSPVTFAGGTIYTATITLTAKAGYTLTGVTANFFTVAGAAATNAANSGVVTAVFPATATAVTASSNGIATATGTTTITLGQIIPGLAAGDIVVKVGGAVLDNSGDTKYTLGGLTTTSVTITFLAAAALNSGSVVTVIMTKAGYVINGGAAITVANTIPATAVTASSNGIATATGTTTITLGQIIPGLAAGDIVVKVGGAVLDNSGDTKYTLGGLTTTSVTITFLAAAALNNTSVVTVIMTKAGYVINGGAAITVANTIAPVIATVSTIANAAEAPTVTVTGTGFKAGLVVGDLTVNVGATDLTFSEVTWVSATEITVAFTGTAAAGDVTIQAKTSAFDPAAGAVSNTLTVTVPAP